MTKLLLLCGLVWLSATTIAAPRPDPSYLESARQNLAHAFQENRPAVVRQSLLTLQTADPANVELETLLEALEGRSDDLFTLEARQRQMPNSALIAQAIGLYHWQHAHFNLACSAFERAHQLAPEHPDPHFSLALCRAQHQDYSTAIGWLQQARKYLTNAITQLTPAQLEQLEAVLRHIPEP